MSELCWKTVPPSTALRFNSSLARNNKKTSLDQKRLHSQEAWTLAFRGRVACTRRVNSGVNTPRREKLTMRKSENLDSKAWRQQNGCGQGRQLCYSDLPDKGPRWRINAVPHNSITCTYPRQLMENDKTKEDTSKPFYRSLLTLRARFVSSPPGPNRVQDLWLCTWAQKEQPFHLQLQGCPLGAKSQQLAGRKRSQGFALRSKRDNNQVEPSSQWAPEKLNFKCKQFKAFLLNILLYLTVTLCIFK